MVVLRSTDSAYEAARAMEANQVGAVPVENHGCLLGIVTDRDLTVRVIGRGLSAAATPLVAIMTPAPSTLPITADETRALELMRARRIRRVPLVEHDRLVGMVTLDDLVLGGSCDPGALAGVVKAQLEIAAPLKARIDVRGPTRSRARHDARAQERVGHLLHLVQAATGLSSRERAETALEIVLEAVIRRIMPDEAEDLMAQLPSKLQEHLLSVPRGPDKSIGLGFIASALTERLELGPDEAMILARATGAALEQIVSEGEIDDVRSQLPSEMRGIFP